MSLNRLANAKNGFQGKSPRVLCVCSAGLLRSPTIAWILSNEPWNCNTRAAGVATEYALIPVDTALIYWADLIVCADEDHAKEVSEITIEAGLVPKRTIYLDIPDNHAFRHPKLIEIINSKLDKMGFKDILQSCRE
jgi:predicted protein tyrosine phosphatase